MAVHLLCGFGAWNIRHSYRTPVFRKRQITFLQWKKVDLRGTVFYMSGLIALVYGSSRIPSVSGWSMMCGGTMALVIFWMIENRSSMPVLDTKMFTQNRLFAYSNLAALINYSATFAIIFLLSLYCKRLRIVPT